MILSRQIQANSRCDSFHSSGLRLWGRGEGDSPQCFLSIDCMSKQSSILENSFGNMSYQVRGVWEGFTWPPLLKLAWFKLMWNNCWISSRIISSSMTPLRRSHQLLSPSRSELHPLIPDIQQAYRLLFRCIRGPVCGYFSPYSCFLTRILICLWLVIGVCLWLVWQWKLLTYGWYQANWWTKCCPYSFDAWDIRARSRWGTRFRES